MRVMGLAIVGLPIFFSATAAASVPDPSSVLWYRQPAEKWMTQALPIGNGTLGGMVFGGTATERLQFNVSSLWTGDDKDAGAYQAFGDVLMELGHQDVKNYTRELNIDEAVHRVRYESGKTRFERTTFASHPAGVIVMRMTASSRGAYSGRIWLTDRHGASLAGDRLRLQSRGRLDNGLLYEAQLLVIPRGGTATVHTTPVAEQKAPTFPDTDNRPVGATYIEFKNCDAVTLILGADTDYLANYQKKWRGEDPHGRVTARVDRAASEAYDTLLREHVADYRRLYQRYALDLRTTAKDLAVLPTDARLVAYATKKSQDPDLEELFAQYGRYLLISSSRPGGLPANLQGIWNDSNSPPWRSDYHSNINIQMNYWLAEPTNLSELHLPFIDYVTSLREVRSKATREQFKDKRGWTVQTENNIYGGSAWRWNPPGSAWYAQHLWEHYAFTGDREYLAKTAYPVLKEITEFWEDRLKVRPDGTLVVPDGWSPEHGPDEEGVTYDQEIVYDLFTNMIEASEVLGVDEPYRRRVADMRARLLKPKIGKWGQLQEWEADIDDPKDQHRHASHLFALHPGRQISPEATPELAKAAKVSLTARGDGSTGWSRAWKINFWARLRDGDHAYRLLRNLLTPVEVPGVDAPEGSGVYINLFDTHPPFQIDGNFGATAGIAEMLVQSQSGEVVLLPALPSAWESGSVKGIRARTGLTLDVIWEKGKLVSVAIQSNRTGKVRLRYLGKPLEIDVRAGKRINIAAKKFAG